MTLTQTVFVDRAVTWRDDLAGIITGYVAIWGREDLPDAYNTWFDREQPPLFGLAEERPIRLMYDHSFDPEIDTFVLGTITRVWADEIGIAFEAQLSDEFKASEHYTRVRDEIQTKLLKTSSASDHTSRFDETGRFLEWYLTEVSLTQYPAEKRMPTVSIRNNTANPIRLKDGNITIAIDSAEVDLSEASSEDVSQSDAPSDATETQAQHDKHEDDMRRTLDELLKEGSDPTPEELVGALVAEFGLDAVKGLIDGLQAPSDEPVLNLSRIRTLVDGLRQPAVVQAVDVEAAIEQAVQRAMTATHSAPPVTPPAPEYHGGNGDGPNIRDVRDNRYDHLTPEQMTLGWGVLEAAGRKPSLDSTYFRAMSMRVADLVRSEKEPQVRGLGKPRDYALRHAVPESFTRADEIMYSTLAGFGDEWVGVAYSTSLWEKVRAARIVDQAMSRGMLDMEVPQGSESIVIPTEGADPTWYKAAQATDHTSGRPDVTATASQVATGNRTLTPQIAKARVDWSDELSEDSLIPMLPQLQRQMEESGAEAVENVMLNGDTVLTASTNLNLIDDTPTTQVYLVSDGMLKLPIITTAALRRDAGASFDESDYQSTYALLPFALQSRMENMAFVVDPSTHIASLNFPSVKTRDTFTAATIEMGKLANIWGIDVLVSGQMALANSAGKIPAAGGTLGRILLVYFPFWAFGWKRRITLEYDRDIASGSNMIVASMRFALTYRSATQSAAASYNVAV